MENASVEVQFAFGEVMSVMVFENGHNVGEVMFTSSGLQMVSGNSRILNDLETVEMIEGKLADEAPDTYMDYKLAKEGLRTAGSDESGWYMTFTWPRLCTLEGEDQEHKIWVTDIDWDIEEGQGE